MVNIYINCTKYPEIQITPILNGKRYNPIKFNLYKNSLDKNSLEQFKDILEKYSKKYVLCYVLSEEQVDFLIKRDTKRKAKTIEAIIEMLEFKQHKKP